MDKYGHVGYVERVESNAIYVWDSTGGGIEYIEPEFSECISNSPSPETDAPCYKNYTKTVAKKYTINSTGSYKVTGYIYLDTAPKTPVNNNSSNNNNNTNNNTTNNNSTNNTNNTQPKPTVTKSSNNDLKSITLNIGEIEFVKENLKYEIEVEYETESIIINAEAEDSKATLTGIGEQKLEVGANLLKIVVTAEDETVKEYEIVVTRKEQKIEEIEETIPSDSKKEEKNKESNYALFAIIGIGTIFAVIIISLIITKIIKKKSKSRK